MDNGFTLEFEDEVYAWLFLGSIEDSGSDSERTIIVIAVGW